MSDLISRQAAIDALEQIFDRCEEIEAHLPESDPDRTGYKMYPDYITVWSYLHQLPSAQPDLDEWCTDCREYDHENLCCPRFNRVIRETVEEVKEAHEEMSGRWIPVSEGLPKEDTDVLISYRYKEGEGDTSHVYIDITSYGDMYFGGRKVTGAKHWRQPFEYFTSNYEVVAWMPLPEPWKGEEG